MKTSQVRSSAGFGVSAVMIVAVAVVVIGLGAYVVARNHSPNKQPQASEARSTTSPQPQPAPQAKTSTFLTITEWDVKLPLSANIADAYYVVSTSSHDAKGQPNTLWLGVKSLDSVGSCAAVKANRGGGPPLASLARSLPTDTDPVTGRTYQQQYPIGTSLGRYYYSYADWVTNRPCTTDAGYKAKLQAVNNAFTNAAQSIVAE